MTKDKIIKYILYLSSMVLIDDLGISPLKIKILAILMVFDIITGILKAYFTKGGNSIRSKALYAGICAKLLIILLPIVVQLCAKGIGVDMSFLVSGLFNWLIIAETYSFITNVRSIKERKNLKEYDAFTIILKVTGDYFLKFLEITKSNFESSTKIDKEKKNEIKEEKENPTKTI